MKKKLARLLATSLSVALVAVNPLTVFALDPADDPHEGAGATANILAYDVDEYVVPTTMNIAINPDGYTVHTVGDATSNEEIVSLNYGVANLSTKPKIINMGIRVTPVGGASLGDIQFVDNDTILEHEANNVVAPEIYLGVLKNNSETAVKTSIDTDFTVTVHTYTEDNPDTVDVNESDDGYNTHNVTGANLSDVTMTLADATTADPFIREEDDDFALCETTFDSLAAATYNIHDHQEITFATTQAQLTGQVMEITDVGGIQGFTITGNLNSLMDWRQANVAGVNALLFTPIYECVDIAVAPVGPTELVGIYEPYAYSVFLPDNTLVDAAEDIENLKVNGEIIPYTVLISDAGVEIVVNRIDLWYGFTPDVYQATDNIVVTFTALGEDFTSTIARDGE